MWKLEPALRVDRAERSCWLEQGEFSTAARAAASRRAERWVVLTCFLPVVLAAAHTTVCSKAAEQAEK